MIKWLYALHRLKVPKEWSSELMSPRRFKISQEWSSVFMSPTVKKKERSEKKVFSGLYLNFENLSEGQWWCWSAEFTYMKCDPELYHT